MVKNTQGGSKHKSMARKLVNAPISSKIRTSECDDECYAIVSKMLGNGMCHVNISYQNNILTNIICHIRGKFRGRNKKANLVSIGSVILIGLRTWEKDISACDLICIYRPEQVKNIKLDQNLYSSISSISSHLNIVHDTFEFSDNKELSTNSIQFTSSQNIDTQHIIDFDAI